MATIATDSAPYTRVRLNRSSMETMSGCTIAIVIAPAGITITMNVISRSSHARWKKVLAASTSAITMTAQSSQRIWSRSTPRERRWRTTTLAIVTRNAATARPASTGNQAANVSAGTGRLVGSRSTPAGHRDVDAAALGRRHDHRQRRSGT